MSSAWVTLVCCVAVLGPVPKETSAEWTLILTHSSDILYHLDELTDDYNSCSSLVTTTVAPITTSSPTTVVTTTTSSITTDTSTTGNATTTPSTTTSSTTTQATTTTTSSTATDASTTRNATTTPSTITSTTTTQATTTTTSSTATDASTTRNATTTPSTTTSTTTTQATTTGTSSTATDASTTGKATTTPSTTTSTTTTQATTTTSSTATDASTTGKATTTPSTTTSTTTTQATTTTTPTTTPTTTTSKNPSATVTSTASTSNTASSSVSSSVTTSPSPTPSPTSPTTSTIISTSIKDEQASHKGSECYGGVARHLSYINGINNTINHDSTVLLNLNAGGMLGGSIWFPTVGIQPLVNATTMLGYHAMGLGYRDFDEGIAAAADYLTSLKRKNVKVVCANVRTEAEPLMKDLVVPSITLQPKTGKKIGIVGYIGKDADFLSDTGELDFTDEAEAINREAEKLKNEGVQFIVALGNAGFEKAKQILSKAPLVDVVVNGGGTSTFLYSGNSPSPNDVPVGEYPYVFRSMRRDSKQLLVQVPRFGKYLGYLNLTIGDDGNILDVNRNSNPVLLANNPDETLQQFVKEWDKEVSVVSGKKLGITLVPLESGKDVCWTRECNAARLMTDAALWYLNLNATRWGESVSAVVWHGGALSDKETEIQAGEVTFGDIVKIFPYANTLAVAEMDATAIRKLFEIAVAEYNQTTSIGEFLHVAGARVEYDISKPAGSRVSRILMRNPRAENADLHLLDDSAVYRIGMPSFIARGQMRFDFMKNLKHNDTNVRDEAVLHDYITFLRVLDVGNEGRVSFLKPADSCVDQTGTVFLTIFLTLLTLAAILVVYKYVYPHVARRRGSQTPLVRMSDLQGY